MGDVKSRISREGRPSPPLFSFRRRLRIRKFHSRAGSRFFVAHVGQLCHAEILVSARRAQAYPSSRNKLDPLGSDSARSAVACLPPSQPDAGTRLDFRLFLALFFPLFSIVLAPATFSLIRARTCIVIGVAFAL